MTPLVPPSQPSLNLLSSCAILFCSPPPEHALLHPASTRERPEPRPQSLGNAAPSTHNRADLFVVTDFLLHSLRNGGTFRLLLLLLLFGVLIRRLVVVSAVVLPHVASLVALLLFLAVPARVVSAFLLVLMLELPVRIVLLDTVLVLVDLRVVDVLHVAVGLNGGVAVLVARLLVCQRPVVAD